MKSVLQSTKSQLGNLGSHVAKQIVHQPIEIIKTAIGQNQNQENQQLSNLEQGNQTQTPSQVTNSPTTSQPDPQLLQRYAQLAPQRDALELKKLRRQLHQEYGLPIDLNTGMGKARQERQQKKEQAEQIEEQKKQQEKLILEEQKKQESQQIIAAKAQAGAETGIGRKIAG